jgi:hypothetical protein
MEACLLYNRYIIIISIKLKILARFWHANAQKTAQNAHTTESN